MLLIEERAGTCPVAVRAGLLDRLMVRARARALDSALACGTSAEASARLALRAQQLVRMRNRRDLARGVRRILAEAERPGPSRSPQAPVCSDRVRAAAAEFRALAGLLLSPAPLPARGVAQARLLVTDGGGPLYRRSCQDDLRALVGEAVRSLDPLAGW
jgi:hypothetical protein